MDIENLFRLAHSNLYCHIKRHRFSGFSKELETAHDIYETLSNLGYIKSKIMLADMYIESEGYRDEEKAIYLLEDVMKYPNTYMDKYMVYDVYQNIIRGYIHQKNIEKVFYYLSHLIDEEEQNRHIEYMCEYMMENKKEFIEKFKDMDDIV